MTAILGYKGSGNRTNESYLESNREAYDDFAFQMGVAYFYSYEENGNKSMSGKWLRIASESDTLEENKRERAHKLFRISEYYSRIGVANKYGDANTGYHDYWDDLVDLAMGNIAQTDNVTTAMMVYKELIYQVYDHAADFRADGVTQEELVDELEYVRQRLDSDTIIANDVNRERNTELKEQLYENLEQARRQVLAVFEARTEGGENGWEQR